MPLTPSWALSWALRTFSVTAAFARIEVDGAKVHEFADPPGLPPGEARVVAGPGDPFAFAVELVHDHGLGPAREVVANNGRTIPTGQTGQSQNVAYYKYREPGQDR